MPVKARVVDQDDRIRPAVFEVRGHPRAQPQQERHRPHRPADVHDRVFGQRVEQVATGGAHPFAAETGEGYIGTYSLKRSREARAVQIAARLTGGNEDVHASASLPTKRAACGLAGGGETSRPLSRERLIPLTAPAPPRSPRPATPSAPRPCGSLVPSGLPTLRSRSGTGDSCRACTGPSPS